MTTARVTVNSGDTAIASPKAPEAAVSVIDADGRRLSIREPSILMESRLVRAMGEAASNSVYMTGYVLPAAMVVAINGEDLQFPMTEREVEAAINVVGRSGLAAVMQHMTEAAKKAEEDGAIKKSGKTQASARPAGWSETEFPSTSPSA